MFLLRLRITEGCWGILLSLPQSSTPVVLFTMETSVDLHGIEQSADQKDEKNPTGMKILFFIIPHYPVDL